MAIFGCKGPIIISAFKFQQDLLPHIQDIQRLAQSVLMSISKIGTSFLFLVVWKLEYLVYTKWVNSDLQN